MSAPATEAASPAPAQKVLIGRLCGIVGPEQVLTSADDLRFFSQDVYAAGVPPVAVVSPGTPEQVADCVKAVVAAGLAVVPRGGGMSYTDGYLSSKAGSVTFDLRRLNRIVTIDVEDRYVTVECGVTWKQLHEVLAPLGMRTPYWGPLSGMRATIGGALSQGSIFLGSGKHGPAAESLLGLDVVLADGSVAQLGAHANRNGEPFFRQYGPDLSAVFTGDCGALGVKVRATLRLIAEVPDTQHASFGFPDGQSLFAVMADVARSGLASELFAFDPGLQKVRMKRVSLSEDVKALGKVMKAAGGGLKGLAAGAKIVLAGRNFLEDAHFSMHCTVEGDDAADAERRMERLRAIVGKRGEEVENTIPKVMRANPFAEVNSMIGPGGERWVPVHGTVPLSKANAMFQALEAVYARNRDACERFDIDHGYLLCIVADRGILIEPVFYWPDARQMFHDRVLDAAYLDKLPRYPENVEARAAVHAMRKELAQVFMEQGAVSFQLGRFYPYQAGLQPSAASLLAAVKKSVDPLGAMNPGVLGLE